ncbi:MAG: UpxY family transcription antiterminator [Bacteroidales bacterium]|nr:UpxY family transcription antiterminator [Bacteroidales bacterium]MCF8405406.1 UpxY family transcription antiterminator [Bacteroidales bacterium]
MTSQQLSETSNQSPVPCPQKFWYALYTRSRFEKKTWRYLQEAGIETYLPLVKTLKQWSDRKKWVEEPLFRSYIFVRISKAEYYDVLNVTGVVRYITFEGKAVKVPEPQIQAIKLFINDEEEHSFSYENLKVGEKVEIFRGSLKGIYGRLVEIRGKQKVKIEIESVGQSIVLTIPGSYLKVIH